MSIAYNRQMESYQRLMIHLRHKIEVLNYAGRHVSVQCLTCNQVLFNVDHPKHRSSGQLTLNELQRLMADAITQLEAEDIEGLKTVLEIISEQLKGL